MAEDRMIGCDSSFRQPQSREELPADVRRLVIAARKVAFEDRSDTGIGDPAIAELDAASEAFADRVPWENEP